MSADSSNDDSLYPIAVLIDEVIKAIVLSKWSKIFFHLISGEIRRIGSRHFELPRSFHEKFESFVKIREMEDAHFRSL